MIPRRPLLLSGGLVFRGDESRPQQEDILIEGAKVHFGQAIPAPEGADVVSLEGLCVSPGWVDLHTHVFRSNGIFSVPPDSIGLRSGVTTLVDAGSAGAFQYKAFAEDVIQQAKESVLAYVNVANTGIPHGHAGRPAFVGDHFHQAFHDIEPALALLEWFAPSIVGWKARLSAALSGYDAGLELQALDRLCELRERSGLPVMVHHVKSSVPPQDLLSRMKSKDVYTHLYHGAEDTIFDRQTGAPLKEALEARDRGVVFDVGHGSGSFSWPLAEKACRDHGFWPDTISSDLHRYNNFWPVVDLATTMSKFLHLGAPVEQVIAMVTGNTRRAIDRPLGRIESGATDLTIFLIEDGEFQLTDSNGEHRLGKKRILPLTTLRRGELLPCNAYFTHGAGLNEFSRGIQAASAY